MTTEAPNRVTLAREELSAALSILLDPASRHRSAQPHLVNAWRLLHETATGDGQKDEELSSWILSQAVPLSGGARARAASLISSLVLDDTKPLSSRGQVAGSRELLRNARDLGRVMDAIESGEGHLPRVWLWRSLKIAAVLALLGWFVVTIRGSGDLGEGPWRGDYFPTETFEGAPTLRRDADINFSWDSEPHERIPEDWFSIRWDTCLEVSEPTLARFDLRSDDGSRLIVDEELLIDSWDGRGRGNAEINLSPGVHHLRVEYFERRGHAIVRLRASMNGAKPAPVPHSVLRYPGEEIDVENPCGKFQQ